MLPKRRPKRKLRQCTQCKIKFSSDFCFNLHSYVHVSRKNAWFPCHVCGRKFSQLSRLLGHRVIHPLPKARKKPKNKQGKDQIRSKCKKEPTEGDEYPECNLMNPNKGLLEIKQEPFSALEDIKPPIGLNLNQSSCFGDDIVVSNVFANFGLIVLDKDEETDTSATTNDLEDLTAANVPSIAKDPLVAKDPSMVKDLSTTNDHSAARGFTAAQASKDPPISRDFSIAKDASTAEDCSTATDSSISKDPSTAKYANGADDNVQAKDLSRDHDNLCPTNEPSKVDRPFPANDDSTLDNRFPEDNLSRANECLPANNPSSVNQLLPANDHSSINHPFLAEGTSSVNQPLLADNTFTDDDALLAEDLQVDVISSSDLNKTDPTSSEPPDNPSNESTRPIPSNLERLYYCNDCGKSFTREVARTKHWEQYHMGALVKQMLLGTMDDTGKCEWSSKTKGHGRKNNDSYPCDQCGRIFNWKSSLYRHIKKCKGIQARKRKNEEKNYMKIDENNQVLNHASKDSGNSTVTNITSSKNLDINATKNNNKTSKIVGNFADKDILNTGATDLPIISRNVSVLIERSSLNVVSTSVSAPDQKKKWPIDPSSSFIIVNEGFGRNFTMDISVTKPNEEGGFSCPLCNKVFKAKASLKEHSRHHTGERPYQCRVCKKRFLLRKTCRKHIKNQHAKEVEKFEMRTGLKDLNVSIKDIQKIEEKEESVPIEVKKSTGSFENEAIKQEEFNLQSIQQSQEFDQESETDTSENEAPVVEDTLSESEVQKILGEERRKRKMRRGFYQDVPMRVRSVESSSDNAKRHVSKVIKISDSNSGSESRRKVPKSLKSKNKLVQYCLGVRNSSSSESESLSETNDSFVNRRRKPISVAASSQRKSPRLKNTTSMGKDDESSSDESGDNFRSEVSKSSTKASKSSRMRQTATVHETNDHSSNEASISEYDFSAEVSASCSSKCSSDSESVKKNKTKNSTSTDKRSNNRKSSVKQRRNPVNGRFVAEVIQDSSSQGDDVKGGSSRKKPPTGSKRKKGDLPFECEICTERFAYESVLRRHQERRGHTNDSYRCSFCHQTYSNLTTYTNHMQQHEKTEAKLERHIADIHDGDEKYKCKHCSKTFDQREYYVRHLDTHDKQYVCDSCDYVSNDSSNFRRHVRHVHKEDASKHVVSQQYLKSKRNDNTSGGQQTFYASSDDSKIDNNDFRGDDYPVPRPMKIREHSCDKCGKVCASQIGLSFHLRYAHENAKNKPNERALIHYVIEDETFICQLCGSTLRDRGAAITHIQEAHLLLVTDEDIKGISKGRAKNSSHIGSRKHEYNAFIQNNPHKRRYEGSRWDVNSSSDEDSLSSDSRVEKQTPRKVPRRDVYSCRHCSAEFFKESSLERHLEKSHFLRAQESYGEKSRSQEPRAQESRAQKSRSQKSRAEHSHSLPPEKESRVKQGLRCALCSRKFVVLEKLKSHLNTFHKIPEGLESALIGFVSSMNNDSQKSSRMQLNVESDAGDSETGNRKYPLKQCNAHGDDRGRSYQKSSHIQPYTDGEWDDIGTAKKNYSGKQNNAHREKDDSGRSFQIISHRDRHADREGNDSDTEHQMYQWRWHNGHRERDHSRRSRINSSRKHTSSDSEEDDIDTSIPMASRKQHCIGNDAVRERNGNYGPLRKQTCTSNDWDEIKANNGNFSESASARKQRESRQATEKHGKSGQFDYPICGQQFNSLKHLEKHASICENLSQNDDPDNINDSSSDDDAPLMMLKRPSNGIDESRKAINYRCNTCKIDFTHATALKRHVMFSPAHSKHGELKCPTCKVVISKNDIDDHRCNKLNKMNRCSICDACFAQSCSLTRHVKSVHSNKKEFPCDGCGNFYMTKTALVSHQKKCYKESA